MNLEEFTAWLLIVGVVVSGIVIVGLVGGTADRVAADLNITIYYRVRTEIIDIVVLMVIIFTASLPQVKLSGEKGVE